MFNFLNKTRLIFFHFWIADVPSSKLVQSYEREWCLDLKITGLQLNKSYYNSPSSLNSQVVVDFLRILTGKMHHQVKLKQF